MRGGLRVPDNAGKEEGGPSSIQRAQVVKETVGWGGVGEALADGSGMVRRAKRGV